jgi:hypothetical protein
MLNQTVADQQATKRVLIVAVLAQQLLQIPEFSVFVGRAHDSIDIPQQSGLVQRFGRLDGP